MTLHTKRLELRPVPAAAAVALPSDRETAARLLGAALPTDWPHADLLDVLPLQAAATSEAEPYGLWAIIERTSQTVVGDAGFIGPPREDGTVEIGYSVIADRRSHGYATEAARALVAWALSQPQVSAVLASCAADNTPSIRVLQRIGFFRTGDTGEQLRWRLDTLGLD